MRILVHISDAMQIDARNVAHSNDQIFPQQFDGFNGVGKPDFILHLACNQDTAQGLVVQADNVVNNCGLYRSGHDALFIYFDVGWCRCPRFTY